MINTIKQNKKAVLAFLLALVMVIGLVPLTATEAHAMTIDATSGDITWESGDSFTLVLANKDDPTKTETHTVTYDGTNWSEIKSDILPAYAFAYKGSSVTDISYTDKWNYTVNLQLDQSDATKLADADVMIATGEATYDAPLNLTFEHYYAKVTFNVELASEFNPETDVISRFDVVTCDGDYVKPYVDGNSYTAVIPANPYFKAGVHFALVTINGEKLEVEIPDEYANPNGSFVAGNHYTFDLKVGKDKVTLTPTTTDTDFPGGWANEEKLNGSYGTHDGGKTMWENGDQIIATLISQKYGEQAVALTYNGSSWSTEASLSYLENETPTITAVYAPDCEIKEGQIALQDGKQYGEAEYILARTTISENSLDINFESGRTYSRLRIAGLANQTLTITTTDFIPAGATEETTAAYTLTTDDNGNAFLYGTFAEGATVSVKQGEVVLKDYTFTPDKNPGGSEHNKSYALDARPVIDGTLGGKATVTKEEVNALVEQLKEYVDNGITTITVTGAEPAMYKLLGSDIPAVSAAIFFLGSSGSETNGDPDSPYCGTIDLIMPDATSLAYMEFCSTYALNSVTLPNVTKIADQAFHDTPYLRTITFGSVLTEVNETGGVMFYLVGKEVGGCDLILNCGQMNESSVPAPDLTANTWKFMFENEFKRITLTHTGECDECKAQ